MLYKRYDITISVKFKCGTNFVIDYQYQQQSAILSDILYLQVFKRSFCRYYLGQQHLVLSQRIGQLASISISGVSKSLATGMNVSQICADVANFEE